MKGFSNVTSSKLKINTLTSILLQIVTAIIGLIMPRLLIGTYGSGVNGLVASITQFLSYISLMEAGAGSVLKAALYKPLVQGDERALSGVLNACQRFYKKIAWVFLIYLFGLAFLYPLFSQSSQFSYSYIVWMVIILGIGTFAQYFFGLTYQLLLKADQKIYFVDILQMVTLILNFLCCYVLIKCNVEIHVVKITTTLIFLLRPIVINFYAKKKYNLDASVPSDKMALKQRWHGFGHHIAYFMHRNTDVAILTFFANYSEISVFSVYNGVVCAVQALIMSVSSGATSKFGELYAKEDMRRLERAFSQYETLIFNTSTLLFTITGIMIVPFVQVYTQGVTDANYQREAVGILMVLSELFYVVRTPYSDLVFAVGEFKGTRNGAFFEAGINLVLSLVLVRWLGIIGVAIGTLVAMLYRTIDYVIYLSKHILKRKVWIFAQKTMWSLLAGVSSFLLSKWLLLPLFTFDNYLLWAVCAVCVTIFSSIILGAVQLIFDRKAFLDSVHFFKN